MKLHLAAQVEYVAIKKRHLVHTSATTGDSVKNNLNYAGAGTMEYLSLKNRYGKRYSILHDG